MAAGGPDRAVVALGVARMADAMANSFLVIVLPLYISSDAVTGAVLGLTPAQVTGLVLAVFGFCNAFAQPFAGRFSDRVGKRKVFVLVGLLFLAVFNAAYSLADTYVTLGLLRMAQGMAVALTATAAVALVNEISEMTSRGSNMGFYNSLRLVGFGTGPLAAGFIVSSGPYGLPGGFEVSGYDAAFWLAGLGALASAGLVQLMVREPERVRVEVGEMAIAVRDRTGDRVLDPIFTLGVATLVMATCIALLSAIEPQVNERLGQDARWFGVQFSVFVLSLAAVQPVVGWMSDQWGRKPFVVWGLVFLVPTTVIQGLVTTPWEMVFARLAQGVAGAMVFAPALALAGDLTTEGQSGLQLSVLTMAFVLGLSGGQLTAGFLVGFGYVVPFAFASALAAGAALLVAVEVEEA